MWRSRTRDCAQPLLLKLSRSLLAVRTAFKVLPAGRLARRTRYLNLSKNCQKFKQVFVRTSIRFILPAKFGSGLGVFSASKEKLPAL
jgi:hypothetical protein